MACLLFCLVLAIVIQKTEEQNPESGMRIGGEILSNLAYSDDTSIMGIEQKLTQKFLNDFSKNASEVGLKINIDKTKCLAISKKERKLDINLGEKKPEQETEFEYLGFKISSSGDQEKAVKHRIGKGWEVFGKFKSTLTSRNVTL